MTIGPAFVLHDQLAAGRRKSCLENRGPQQTCRRDRRRTLDQATVGRAQDTGAPGREAPRSRNAPLIHLGPCLQPAGGTPACESIGTSIGASAGIPLRVLRPYLAGVGEDGLAIPLRITQRRPKNRRTPTPLAISAPRACQRPFGERPGVRSARMLSRRVYGWTRPTSRKPTVAARRAR